MMTTDITTDIAAYTQGGVTTIERTDLGIRVGAFHRQGNWRLRCYIGPDEYIASEWATREAAESVALKHAARF
jgi:hypothetical protein